MQEDRAAEPRDVRRVVRDRSSILVGRRLVQRFWREARIVGALVDPSVVQRARRIVVPHVVGVHPAVRIAHTGVARDPEDEVEGVGAARCSAIALALAPGLRKAVVADPRCPRPEGDATTSTARLICGERRVRVAVRVSAHHQELASWVRGRPGRHGCRDRREGRATAEERDQARRGERRQDPHPHQVVAVVDFEVGAWLRRTGVGPPPRAGSVAPAMPPPYARTLAPRGLGGWIECRCALESTWSTWMRWASPSTPTASSTSPACTPTASSTPVAAPPASRSSAWRLASPPRRPP